MAQAISARERLPESLAADCRPVRSGMSSTCEVPSHRSTPLWGVSDADGKQRELPPDYCRRLEGLWQYNYNVPLARTALGSDGQRFDIDFQHWVMKNSDTQEALRLHRLGGPHLCVFLGGQSEVARGSMHR
uniref:Uncharacterized protein n=1 Tax=Alexandrium catenella TaxID=2925 RepID=A0A7S1WS48_ALECA